MERSTASAGESTPRAHCPRAARKRDGTPRRLPYEGDATLAEPGRAGKAKANSGRASKHPLVGHTQPPILHAERGVMLHFHVGWQCRLGKQSLACQTIEKPLQFGVGDRAGIAEVALDKSRSRQPTLWVDLAEWVVSNGWLWPAKVTGRHWHKLLSKQSLDVRPDVCESPQEAWFSAFLNEVAHNSLQPVPDF